MLPKIIDLFSGCGGLAVGFEKAGFEVAGGIELMPEAYETISYNLDYRYDRSSSYICGDITEIDEHIFADRFGNEGCVVIGGPPCQAYSIAGKAKLRSLGDSRINIRDSRGYLYLDFIRFAFGLNAKAVIMENVPESVNFGSMNIPETVCQLLDENGYSSFWTLLNAADYGVPQIRERVFVFALNKDVEGEILLPVPTNGNNGPYSSQYSRRLESFSKNTHFKPPVIPGDSCPPWITVGDAFSDLPILLPDISFRYRNVELNEEMEYRCPPQNAFQKTMRTWYGIESYGVTANAFRNNERDRQIFSCMKQGDDYVSASLIADSLFEKEAEVYGFEPGTDDYVKLKKKMVPVYDREKFTRKWLRLEESMPSHTIVAHLAKDTYSHIHPVEPRGISVREAARLQSFPDDFFFDCSMGDAFKQIGNAVPPLLSYAVAKSVKNLFKEDV